MRYLKSTIIAIPLLLAAASALAEENNEVLRVYHVPRAEINQLRYYGDVWSLNWREDYVHIHATPRGRRALEDLGYTVETDREETERLEWFRAIDREAWRLSGAGGIPGFPCYRTVDETHATLADLAAAYPQYARLELIGQSWQAINNPPTDGDIYALVIANQDSPHEQAPLVIMAAQHARELTTAETATRFAELLLESRETDGDIAWLLDHREIHIIAQQNPDGRRQVEGQVVPAPPPQGLMWRKNHNTAACGGGSSPQIGIDLNRNSSFLWGPGVWPGASSGNTCDQTYRGTAEASEPETQTVEDYLEDVFEDQRPPDMDAPAPDDAKGIFISIHSYSELVLFPWDALGGGAANHSPNHNQLAWLGRKFGYFTGYQVGRDILYAANGTTTDYVYGRFGVAAYTYELGTSFLQTCASFENPIWPRVRDALLYAAKAAERPYQAPSGPDVIDLDAVYNSTSGQVGVTATADGTRYDRGGVSESPASDPVLEITEAVASFDLPPHLAVLTFDLTLTGSGASVGLGGELPLTSGLMRTTADELAFDNLYAGDTQTMSFDVINEVIDTENRLLFVTASDAGNATGVPTAVWITGLEQADPGTDELELSSIDLLGDSVYQVSGGDCAAGSILMPGTHCSIEVTFAPDDESTFTGQALVQAVDGQEVAIALSGAAQFRPPELAVDRADLDFGEVVAGEGGTMAFTVSNIAGEWATDLELSTIDVTGNAEFQIAGGECGSGTALAPQQSCTVEISFSPDAAGTFGGQVTIETGDGQNAGVELSGTGIELDPGELEVTPQSLDFGELPEGAGAALTVTVSNAAAVGAAGLAITRIEVIAGEDAFAVDLDGGDCGDTLAPQVSCTVELQFSPPAAGAYSGVLRVAADGEAVNVNLSGNGIEIGPAIFEDRFEDQ